MLESLLANIIPLPHPHSEARFEAEIDSEITATLEAARSMPMAIIYPDPLLSLPPGWTKRVGQPAFFTAPLRHTKGAEDAGPIQVSGPFDIVGEVGSEDGTGCGLLLRWQVRGVTRQRVVNRGELESRGSTVATSLRSEGFEIAAGQAARFESFLVDAKHDRFIPAVDRAGWHRVGGQFAFVAQDGTITGGAADAVALRGAAAALIPAGGSLADWQSRIARLAVGNSRLMVGIALGFAGFVLDVAGATSIGLNVVGKSQSGKSTIANAAASVVGPLTRVRSWRASCNGLEGAAALACDSMMVLDELQASDPREAGDATYCLANGAGKSRAARDGSARAVATWRVAVLSTSEVTLAQHLATAGRTSMSGHDVRLIDLPAQAGADAGMGAWENLHGFATPREIADAITSAARDCFSTAGTAFLARLVDERNADADGLRDRVQALRDGFVSQNVPAGADSQVYSIAAKFGLIVAAGTLASDYGIVPWPDGSVTLAALRCFAAWCEQRGGVGSGEDRRIIETVRACLAAHGMSRFAELFPSGRAEAKIRDQIGWRRERDGETEFLIQPDAWKRVFVGIDPARAARVLSDRGFLRTEGAGGRNLTVRESLPPLGRLRVYALSSRVMV